MFMRLSLCGLCLLGLSIAPAKAEDLSTAKWGQVGGWDIRVDRSIGNGCFASQLYEDQTSIRLGFDLTTKTIYFNLGNVGWKSLEVGKLYKLRFMFDDQYPFDGELRGITFGNRSQVFLNHSNVSEGFTKAFMERSYVRIYYQGQRFASLSLRNTYAAVAEVINCQREMLNAGGGSSDGGSQRSSDPFSGARSGDPFVRQ